MLLTSAYTLQVTVGEAITTNALTCTGDAADYASGSESTTLASLTLGDTTGETTTTVFDATDSANTMRDIREIAITNLDTVSHTVTPARYDVDEDAEFSYGSWTLPAGCTLFYNKGPRGWWISTGTQIPYIPLASGNIMVGNDSGMMSASDMSGDVTIDDTGETTVSKIGGYSVSLSGALTTGGALTFSGAFAAIFSIPGAYTWTLPAVSGTLAALNKANTWSAAQTVTDNTHSVTINVNDISFSGGAGYFSFSSYMALYVNGETAGAGVYSLAIWNDGTFVIGGDAGFQGNIYPTATNTYTSGTASNAWSGGYTETEFTITSDKNYKTIIERLKADPSLCKFAYALGGNITVFQLNTAIENKGSDDARYHVGLIAQEVGSLASDYGIDLDKYGLYCYDETYVTTTEVKDSDKKITSHTVSESESDALSADTDGVDSSTDENGTVTLTSTDTATDGTVTTVTTVHAKRYSLRYQEIAMLMAGAQYLANEAIRESLSLTVDDIFPDTTDSDSSTSSTSSTDDTSSTS